MTRTFERRGGQSAARWVLGCGELRTLLDENNGTMRVWPLVTILVILRRLNSLLLEGGEASSV